VAFAAVIRVSDDNPTGISDTANVGYVGINAESTLNPPNANEAPITSSTRGWLRRAASRAPPSDPIAMIEPSSPYSPAPLSNSVRAIRAVVSWKFRPNVPIMPINAMIRIRSGRPRT
jgi:hypothetical protein